MYKILVIFFCFSLIGNGYAQSADPRIQQKIDDLQKWMKNQLEKTGKIDQHKLDSMNQLIRDEQLKIQGNASETEPSSIEQNLSKRIIIKQYPCGSSFTVPLGKKWKVIKMTVTSIDDASSYEILVKSVKIENELMEGDKLIVPFYTSESELLGDDTSGMMYTFTIEETNR